jgi:hypothetical protein
VTMSDISSFITLTDSSNIIVRDIMTTQNTGISKSPPRNALS